MQKAYKIFFVLLLFTIISGSVSSQEFRIPSLFRTFLNVDSILWHTKEPVVFMNEVIVFPQKQFKNERERRRYNRLMRNFKIVYPYAVELGNTYRNIEDSLFRFRNEDQRKEYVKMREKQLTDHYKPIFSNMTLSQGVLMVKLLDRQTGSTAYEIVEELKGSVRAFFWHSFALLFGNSLKREYDAEGNDRDIEMLVIRYENGTL